MLTRLALYLTLVLFIGSAAAFDLVDSKGRRHRLAQYEGKWVLVNFWATWCPPCLEEIPDLIALHEDKKNNLVVLGVAMDYGDKKQVLRFAEEQMISYPIIFGDSKVVAQVGAVTSLPTTYLYDPAGKIVAYEVGLLSRAAVESYVRTKGKPVKK